MNHLDRTACHPTLPSVAARSLIAAVVGAILLTGCTHMQQAGDLSYEPPVPRPAYAEGAGPLVLIDESHCNFHTATGRYAPFADLLGRDGFRVEPLGSGFTADGLAEATVLVVANAMPVVGCDTWKLPAVGAFATGEIETLIEWVEGGGALLLIADHMPFPGAAENLADALGLVFINGYVRTDEGESQIRFDAESGTLGDHAVTRGRDGQEQVTAVVSFTGQGFWTLRDAEPLLTLPAQTRVRLPRKAGKFTDKTPEFSAEGLLQGAVFEVGQGRVAVFGEAAMFSAQEYTRDGELRQMGMNAPGAEGNVQFALNLMHWLAGLLE